MTPLLDALFRHAAELPHSIAYSEPGGSVRDDEVIEVFGTFGHEVSDGDLRSVRERRGYVWQERHPASDDALSALDAPLTDVSGIGDSRAEQFARLGAHHIRDLLTLFPRRYDDYTELKTTWIEFD